MKKPHRNEVGLFVLILFFSFQFAPLCARDRDKCICFLQDLIALLVVALGKGRTHQRLGFLQFCVRYVGDGVLCRHAQYRPAIIFFISTERGITILYMNVSAKHHVAQ